MQLLQPNATRIKKSVTIQKKKDPKGSFFFCLSSRANLRFLRFVTKRSALRLGWKNREKAMLWLFRRFFTADTRLCLAEWRRQKPGVKELEVAPTMAFSTVLYRRHPLVPSRMATAKARCQGVGSRSRYGFFDGSLPPTPAYA